VDLARLASWLRCPVCADELQALPPLVLRCARGHSVDANKRGYATLLAPGTRVVGDTAEMLAARGRFLDRSHYQPIVEAVLRAVGDAEASRPSGPAGTDERERLRVLDAGCGTGHYLRAVLDHLPGSTGLAADLSPAAVAIAVRGRPDVDGLVADTWASLPLRDGAVDLVLDVFAPRNLPEFHRGRPVVPSASRRTRGSGSWKRPIPSSPRCRRRACDGSCRCRTTTSPCCWAWDRPPTMPVPSSDLSPPG
jgi:23S rRNA (guanine745-N1)-methyltransferase